MLLPLLLLLLLLPSRCLLLLPLPLLLPQPHLPLLLLGDPGNDYDQEGRCQHTPQPRHAGCCHGRQAQQPTCTACPRPR